MGRTLNSSSWIGLIPAGGWARRLRGLPCSKEIYPLGPSGTPETRRKPVIVYLLERMGRAGIAKAFVIIRPGKWDIPETLGSHRAGVDLAYALVSKPYGPPFTLDAAYRFVRDHWVAFGFPDILISLVDPYSRLAELLLDTRADVVLGLLPAVDPKAVGIAQVDNSGRVLQVWEKPAHKVQGWMWCLAVWGPRFTEYLHRFVQAWEAPTLSTDPPPKEVPMGEVLQKALHDGLDMRGLIFPTGRYLDIGTPETLAQAPEFLAFVESSSEL